MHAGNQLGFDRARGERIDGDTHLGEFDRKHTGQHDHAAFSCSVSCPAGPANDARRRCNIYNSAVPAIGNYLPSCPITIKRPRQIDIDQALPLRVASLQKWALNPNAGAVYQNVQTSKLSDACSDHRVDLITGRNVDLKRIGGAGSLAVFGVGELKGRGHVHVGN